MRAVYDYADVAVATLAARQIPYADQTLDQLFPTRPVDDVDYRLVQGQTLDQTVPARAFDTPATLIQRAGINEIRGGLPAFTPMDLITETDSIRARRLNGLPIDLGPAVNETAARTTRTILNSLEKLKGMALSLGGISLNGNGVIQSVDFGVPGPNKVVASTPWTNVAAPMDTDLDSWRTAFIASAGGPPERILTSSRAKRLALRNTSIINATSGASNGRTMAFPNEFDATLAALELPRFETYDRQFGSIGNLTRVIPENILLMLPAGAIGETQLGVTEEAIQLVQAQILAASQAPGITVVTLQNDNPVQRAVKSAAIGMPVIELPYQLLIATLW